MAPAKLLNLRAPTNRPPAPPADDRIGPWAMVDLITCGLTGIDLKRALMEDFPTVPRADVYLAVGAAVALMQADLVLAEMEIDILKGAARE